MQGINLKIKPNQGRGYKSIKNLEWSDIPNFAIITGRNGSGKTQVLELLAYHLSGISPPGDVMPSVELDGVSCKPSEVGYIPSGGLFTSSVPSSLRDMHSVRTQAVQSIQNVHAYRNNIQETIRLRKMMERLGVQHVDPASIEEYALKLSDDFEFAIDDLDTIRGLSHVFFAFRIKKMEARERGQEDVSRDGVPLGPAPWIVLNDALKVAGFPYEVNSPEETSLIEPFVLKLRDKVTKEEIRDIDLSSGEKVIFQLVLWLFAAETKGLFPKLLLLDEPDAHLHPSMTLPFLDVISEVFVRRHGVRVIMSSHSPSTVALAPVDSIFQIDRLSNKVEKIYVRAEIISILTAGLVTVSRSTKFFFVEDEDDLGFYSAIYDILSDKGPSRDLSALMSSPTIVFIPVSVGSNASKISGGASIVKKWVEKLDAEPLNQTFFGVIDRDVSNTGSARIFVTGRYSFENYLIDPLNVLSLLIEEGAAPHVEGLKISAGDEHLLRLESAEQLQKASNAIVLAIECVRGIIGPIDHSLIKYTNGASIYIPKWFIDQRGHDALPIVQQAFLGARVVSPPRLLKTLRRGRLIPQELADLFAKMQMA